MIQTIKKLLGVPAAECIVLDSDEEQEFQPQPPHGQLQQNANVHAQLQANASTRSDSVAAFAAGAPRGPDPEGGPDQQLSDEQQDADLQSASEPQRSEATGAGDFEDEHSLAPPEERPQTPEPESASVGEHFVHTLGQNHRDSKMGALAEFFDNSRDASANLIKIERATVPRARAEAEEGEQESADEEAIAITDDGSGMTEAELRTCFNMGSSIKSDVHVGGYGIGFKSGVLRVARRVAVFTVARDGRRSVGLFPWAAPAAGREGSAADGGSLKFIVAPWDDAASPKRALFLRESGFGTAAEVEAQFEAVGACGVGPSASGTRVVLCGLKNEEDQRLVFSADGADLQVLDEKGRPFRLASRVKAVLPNKQIELDYSVRAYAALLFDGGAAPAFEINDRPVDRIAPEAFLGLEDRSPVLPVTVLQANARLTLGFSRYVFDDRLPGGLLYYKDRLIESFVQIGEQHFASTVQQGLAAVLRVDAANSSKNDVINTKQAFDWKLRVKISDVLAEQGREFWAELATKGGPSFLRDGRAQQAAPRPPADPNGEFNWVQCSGCSKWRRLHPGHTPPGKDEAWYCAMAPDRMITCEEPEDPWDKGDVAIASNVGSAQRLARITAMEASIAAKQKQKHILHVWGGLGGSVEPPRPADKRDGNGKRRGPEPLEQPAPKQARTHASGSGAAQRRPPPPFRLEVFDTKYAIFNEMGIFTSSCPAPLDFPPSRDIDLNWKCDTVNAPVIDPERDIACGFALKQEGAVDCRDLCSWLRKHGRVLRYPQKGTSLCQDNRRQEWVIVGAGQAPPSHRYAFFLLPAPAAPGTGSSLGRGLPAFSVYFLRDSS
eukprot:tig00020539_g10435.t1